MPTLTLTPWMGLRCYGIVPDPDGGSEHKLRPGEKVVATITADQAAKGVEFCSLLFEAGRLT